MSYFRTNIYNSDLIEIPYTWVVYFNKDSKNFNQKMFDSLEEKEKSFLKIYAKSIKDYKPFISLSELPIEDLKTLKRLINISGYDKKPVHNFTKYDVKKALLNSIFESKKEIGMKLFELCEFIDEIDIVKENLIRDFYGDDVFYYILKNNKKFIDIVENDKKVCIACNPIAKSMSGISDTPHLLNFYENSRYNEDETVMFSADRLIDIYLNELFIDEDYLNEKILAREKNKKMLTKKSAE